MSEKTRTCICITTGIYIAALLIILFYVPTVNSGGLGGITFKYISIIWSSQQISYTYLSIELIVATTIYIALCYAFQLQEKIQKKEE